MPSLGLPPSPAAASKAATRYVCYLVNTSDTLDHVAFQQMQAWLETLHIRWSLKGLLAAPWPIACLGDKDCNRAPKDLPRFAL